MKTPPASDAPPQNIVVAHDLDDGIVLIDRALALNANLAMAWHSSGWSRVFLGEPDVAIKHLNHAMRLSPLDPLIFRAQGGMAYAHFFANHLDEAYSWAEKSILEQPNYRPAIRVAAASAALAGRVEDAEKAVGSLRMLDPALRLSNLS